MLRLVSLLADSDDPSRILRLLTDSDLQKLSTLTQLLQGRAETSVGEGGAAGGAAASAEDQQSTLEARPQTMQDKNQVVKSHLC